MTPTLRTLRPILALVLAVVAAVAIAKPPAQVGKTHFLGGMIYSIEVTTAAAGYPVLSQRFVGVSPYTPGQSYPGPGPFSPNVAWVIENPANPAEWVYSYYFKASNLYGIYRTLGDLPVTDADVANATEVLAPQANGLGVVQVSPDGQKIYFTQQIAGKNSLWARSMTPGPTPTKLLDNIEWYWGLSPDGATIAYSVNTTQEGDPFATVLPYIANADGTNPKALLTTAESTSTFLGWHPNSSKMLFGYRDRQGPNFDEKVYALDKSGQVVGSAVGFYNTGDNYTAAFDPGTTDIAAVQANVGLFVSHFGQYQSLSYRPAGNTQMTRLFWTPSKFAIKSLSLPSGPLLTGYTYQATVSLTSPTELDTTANLNESALTVDGTGTIKAGGTTCTFNFQVIPRGVPPYVTLYAHIDGVADSPGQTIDTKIIVPTSLTIDKPTIQGGESGTATVTISDPAGPKGLQIGAYSTVFLSVPTNVTVPAGKTVTTFTYTGGNVSVPVASTIYAYGGTNTLSAAVTLIPSVIQSFTLSSNQVIAGSNTILTGTVNLLVAFDTDTVINLSSDRSGVTVPATVTVPAGLKTATFNIDYGGDATGVVTTITARYGTVSQTAHLTVNAVTLSLTLTPNAVLSGTNAVGTVKANAIAGSAGYKLQLTSDSPKAVVPATVTIAPGKSSVTFPITTLPVDADTPLNIIASLGFDFALQPFTIKTYYIADFKLSPTSVPGGLKSIGTVTLNGPAGPNGFKVSLKSSDVTVATVPGSVYFASGQSVATFTVNTGYVPTDRPVQITATRASQVQTLNLQVLAPALTGLSTSSASVAAGSKLTGTVFLSAPAGPGGKKVNLNSTDTAHLTPPASVLIPQGKTSATFPLPFKAAATNISVTLRASAGGPQLQTSVRIIASVVKSLTFSPVSVFGNLNVFATVTLAAPADDGQVVTVTSSMPSVAPSFGVTFQAGTKTKTVTTNTFSVTALKTVTFTAASYATSVRANLTVKPTALKSIQLSPATVKGGATTSGVIVLETVAPAGGFKVTLQAASPAIAPAYVLVPAGQTSAPFDVRTKAVTKATKVTITATGVATKSTVLTVNP